MIRLVVNYHLKIKLKLDRGKFILFLVMNRKKLYIK